MLTRHAMHSLDSFLRKLIPLTFSVTSRHNLHPILFMQRHLLPMNKAVQTFSVSEAYFACGSGRAGPRRLLWRAGERGERDRGPSFLPLGLALRNNRKDKVPELDDEKSPGFFACLENGFFFCIVPNS